VGGELHCLVVALENLYVEKGLIEKGIIENLNLGKELRESADYRSTFSREGVVHGSDFPR
jgi:uncharacterized protein (UPF0332 family)